MIVLKDKKDIKFAPKDFLSNYKWESHGQYDSLDFVNPDVKILSVQFTKVGDKTYKAFPNLEWIIVRQHGYDNVNLNECEKRGIGVITTKPFAQSTADWINQYINDDDKIGLIGNGSIGSKVVANNIEVITRQYYLNPESHMNFNTLVVTVPPENNKHLITTRHELQTHIYMNDRPTRPNCVQGDLEASVHVSSTMLRKCLKQYE